MFTATVLCHLNEWLYKFLTRKCTHRYLLWSPTRRESQGGAYRDNKIIPRLKAAKKYGGHSSEWLSSADTIKT